MPEQVTSNTSPEPRTTGNGRQFPVRTRTRLSLRWQTLLASGLCMILFAAVLFGVLRDAMLDSFVEVEDEIVARDTQRVLNALDTELHALDSVAQEWALSADMAAFARGKNDSFAETISDSSLRNFDLNLILVIGPSGEVVFGRAYDPKNDIGISLSTELVNTYLAMTGLSRGLLQAWNYSSGVLLLPKSDVVAPLTEALLEEDSSYGIDESSLSFTLPSEAVLVAVETILEPSGQPAVGNAPVGTLILGRLLPKEAFTRLGEVTETSLTSVRVDDSNLPADFRRARAALLAGEPLVQQELSDEMAAGYALITDIQGEPGLILRVEAPRRVYAQGRQSLNTTTGLFVGMAIGLLLVIWFLLDVFVVRRVLNLNDFVRRVVATGDLTRRAVLRGWDELTDLAASINALLAMAQESQSSLAASERRLHQIVTSISDIVYTAEFTSDWQLVRHWIPSPQIESLSGYPHVRFTEDFTFWQSLMLPDATGMHPQFQDIVAAPTSNEIEYPIQRADGDTVWVRDSRHVSRVPDSDHYMLYGVISDITAHKATEAELAAERNLLRTVINNLPATTVYIKDRDGRVLLCNAADLRFRAVESDEEVIGKTDFDFYPPEMAARFHDAERQIVRTGQPLLNHEEQVAAPGQPPRWLLTTKVPLRAPDGTITHIVGVGHDITDRKQMEEELRATHEMLEQHVAERTAELAYERNLLRTLVDALPDNVFVKDRDHRFVLLNAAQARHLQVEGDISQVVGMRDHDFYPPEVAAHFMADEEKILQGEVASVYQEEQPQLQDEPGPSPWYWTVKVPLRNPDGEIVGLVGLARDITERKRMEEELRAAHDLMEQRVVERTAELQQALEDLRISEDRFTYAFNYAPQGIALVSLDEKLFRVNEAYAAMLGYTVAELTGMPIASVTVPDDVHLTDDNIQLALTERGEVYQFEKRYRHKTGRMLWAQVTFSIMNDAEGEPSHFIAHVHDITDRKRIEAEREALIRKIQTRASELATVAEISRQAATILDISRLLWTASDLIKDNFNFYHVHIFLLEEDQHTLRMVAGAGEIGHTLAATRFAVTLDSPLSLVADAARRRERVVANDVVHEPIFLAHPLLANTRSELAIPMLVGDDLIGVLNIEDDHTDRFDTDDVHILGTLAAQLAIALHNARLFTENGRRLAILENSQDLIALTHIDQPDRIGYINRTGVALLGYDSPSDVLGASVLKHYTPMRRRQLLREVLPIVRAEGAWRGEFEVLTAHGEAIPVEQTILSIPNPHGTGDDLATIMTNITERKRAQEALQSANRAFRVLSDCNQAMVREQNESALLHEICEIIVQASGYHAAWVAYALDAAIPADPGAEDSVTVYVASRAGDGLDRLPSHMTITQADIDGGRSLIGRALQTGEPQIVNDVFSHPAYDVHRERLDAIGYRASLTLPLVQEGQPFGALNVYSLTRDEFDTDEVSLLSELASDLSYGIAALRTQRARQEMQDKLQESRANLIALIGNTADYIWSVGRDYRLVTWNAAYDQHYRALHQRSPLVGQRPLPLPGQPEAEWYGYYDQALAGERFVVEHQYQTAEDAPVVYLETAFNPIVADEGTVTGVAVFSRDRTRRKADEERLWRLNAQLEQHNTQLLKLHDAGRTLTSTLDAAAIYDVLYRDIVQRLFKADTCTVSLYDSDQETITCVFSRVDGVAVPTQEFPVLPLGTGPQSAAIRTQQVQVVNYTAQAVLDDTQIVRTNDKLIPAVGLYVPLSSGKRVLGVLVIQHYDEQAFDESTLRMASIVANQAAAALENARLFAAEREQRALAEALRDITATLNQTLDLESVMDRILENIRHVVPHDTASILLVEGDMGRIVRHTGFVERGLEDAVATLSFAVAGSEKYQQMMRTGEPFYITNVQENEFWEAVPGLDWVQAYIGAPIMVAGEMLGVINLDSATPDFFTADHAAKLKTFAEQAAIALRNARSFAAEHEQRRLAEALNDITTAINSTLKLDQTLARILENVGLVVPHVAANVMLVDSDEMYVAAHRGYAERGLGEYYDTWRIKLADRPDMQGELERNEPYLVNDTRTNAKWVDVPQDRWIRSCLGVPIVVKGRVLGVLNLDHDQTNAFSERDKDRLRVFTNQAATAVHNAQLFAAEREQRTLSEALSDTAAVLNRSLEPETVIANMLQYIQQAIPYEMATITLFDGDMAYIAHHLGYVERGLEQRVANWSRPIADLYYTQQMRATGQAILIADTQDEEHWQPSTDLHPEQQIRSTVKAPLYLDEEMVGAIHLEATRPHAFTQRDADRLRMFTSQAASALRNARLFASERTQRRYAEALSDTAVTLNRLHDLEPIMDRILQNVARAIEFDSATLMLVDEHGNVRIPHYRGYDTPELVEWIKNWEYRLEDLTFSREIAADPKTLYIGDLRESPLWALTVERFEPVKWMVSALKTPILVDGQVVGILNVESATPHAFSEHDIVKLEAFASQISNALRNVRLYDAEREQRVLAEALRDTAATITSSLDFDTVLHRILSNARHVVPHDLSALMFVDGDEAYVRGSYGYEAFALEEWASQVRLTISAIRDLRDCMATGQPQIISDTRADPDWVILEEMDMIRSHITLPIQSDGAVVAFLQLDSFTPDYFTPEHLKPLMAFTDQAASAIRHAQMYADERDQRRFAEALSEMTAAINTILEPEAVLERLLDTIGTVIPYDGVTVMLRDAGDELRVPHHRGYIERGSGDFMANWVRTLDSFPYGRELERTGRSILLRDTLHDETWMDSVETVPETQWIRSTIKTPIMSEGRLIGIINLDSTTPYSFDESDIRKLESFANQAANALRNAQTFTAERAQRKFAEALSDTASVINRTLDLDEVLDHILEHLQTVLPHDAANVMFIEHGVARIARGHGYAERGLGEWIGQLRYKIEDVPLWQQMLADRQPFATPNTALNEYWQRFLTPQEEWIKSTAKAPIQIDGKIIGILHIDSATPYAFDETHAQRLQAFAHQAANAIRNARLFTAEREQRVLAEALRDSAAALNSSLKRDEVLDLILTHVGRVAPYDVAEILLIDDDETARLARFRVTQNELPLTQEMAEVALPVQATPNLRTMLVTQRPQMIEDTTQVAEWRRVPGWEWLRSQAGAPIKHDEKVIGFVMLDSRAPNFYTPEIANQLQAFADQAAVALINAEMYAERLLYAERLERAVEDRTAELKAQHARLETILFTMEEGVIFRMGGETQFVNRACSELLGYSLDELRDNFDVIEESISRQVDNREEIYGQMARTLERGRTWRFDTTLVRKDNSPFDGAVSVAIVPDADPEQPSGLLIMIRDISQERALQQQKDRFIANASHELRTPLANIKTRLYLLRHQPDKLPQHMEILERVSDEMNELIESLLDVSRFERGVINLVPRPMVLQELVERTIQVQRAEAEKKSIALELDQPAVPIQVLGDHRRLRQVITNLLTNALNYTPEGGTVTVRLEPDPAAPDERVMMRVVDTGIGISAEQLEHVFEPFFRANEGAATGTGLGLTIAREIVLLHGGELSVESVEGVGSMFSVALKLLHE